MIRSCHDNILFISRLSFGPRSVCIYVERWLQNDFFLCDEQIWEKITRRMKKLNKTYLTFCTRRGAFLFSLFSNPTRLSPSLHPPFRSTLKTPMKLNSEQSSLFVITLWGLMKKEFLQSSREQMDLGVFECFVGWLENISGSVAYWISMHLLCCDQRVDIFRFICSILLVAKNVVCQRVHFLIRIFSGYWIFYNFLFGNNG